MLLAGKVGNRSDVFPMHSGEAWRAARAQLGGPHGHGGLLGLMAQLGSPKGREFGPGIFRSVKSDSGFALKEF